MHLLATNLCVWFVTAVTETAEDYRQQDYISHSQFIATSLPPAQCFLTTVSSWTPLFFLLSACLPQSVHGHFSSSCSVLAHHSSLPLLIFLLNACTPQSVHCRFSSYSIRAYHSSLPLLIFLLNTCTPQSVHCHFSSSCSMHAHHSSLPLLIFLLNTCTPQSAHCHFSLCSMLAHLSQFTATSLLPAQCLHTSVSSRPLLFLLNAYSPQSVHGHFSSSCSLLAHHNQFMATSLLPAQCVHITVIRVAESQLCGLNRYK